MIRKSILALAAVAALGLTAAGSTDALAKGKGGHHGGGWHKHHHHHHGGHHWRRGFRIGFYAPAYEECYKVVTRRGRIKLVCY